MRFRTTATVLGIKRSKGTFEDRNYDSTKVFISMSLDTSKGDAAGQSASELTWGLSDNFAKFASATFPFHAELDMEQVIKGKNPVMILHDVKPIPNKPVV